MIIIADSGSTKTDWICLEGDDVLRSFRSPGLNPFFHSTEEVIGILQEVFSQHPGIRKAEAVFFYGAGCSSMTKKAIIHDALKVFFPNKHIDVEHDMLAAARALFGKKPGTASILGTGSNSCIYDGEIITEHLFSTGYLFGDEGSGAHLGKTYIAAHLKETAPREIRQAFMERYGMSNEEILTNVYKKAGPNRFLASFSPFLKEHIGHPYVHDLVESCFDAFFEQQLSRFTGYKTRPFGCIGSVAYHFRDILQLSAHKHGVQPGIFMASPLESLVRFHAKHT